MATARHNHNLPNFSSTTEERELNATMENEAAMHVEPNEGRSCDGKEQLLPRDGGKDKNEINSREEGANADGELLTKKRRVDDGGRNHKDGGKKDDDNNKANGEDDSSEEDDSMVASNKTCAEIEEADKTNGASKAGVVGDDTSNDKGTNSNDGTNNNTRTDDKDSGKKDGDNNKASALDSSEEDDSMVDSKDTDIEMEETDEANDANKADTDDDDTSNDKSTNSNTGTNDDTDTDNDDGAGDLQHGDNSRKESYADFAADKLFPALFPKIHFGKGEPVPDDDNTNQVETFDHSRYDDYFGDTVAITTFKNSKNLKSHFSGGEKSLLESEARSQVTLLVLVGPPDKEAATAGETDPETLFQEDVLTSKAWTEKYKLEDKITSTEQIDLSCYGILPSVMQGIANGMTIPDWAGIKREPKLEYAKYGSLHKYLAELKGAKDRSDTVSAFTNHINECYSYVFSCDMKNVNGVEKIEIIDFMRSVTALFPPMEAIDQSLRSIPPYSDSLEPIGIPFAKITQEDFKHMDWGELFRSASAILQAQFGNSGSRSKSFVTKDYLHQYGLVGKPHYKDRAWYLHLKMDPSDQTNLTATLLFDTTRKFDSPKQFTQDCPYGEMSDFMFQPKIEDFDEENCSALVRWGGQCPPTRFFEATHAESYPCPVLKQWTYNPKNEKLDAVREAVHDAWKPQDEKDKTPENVTKRMFNQLFIRITVKELDGGDWIIRHAKFVTPDCTYIPDETKELKMDPGQNGMSTYKRCLMEYYVGRVAKFTKMHRKNQKPQK